MTPLEKRAYDTLLEVRGSFSARPNVPHIVFMEVMGHVRDALRAFEAEAVGCPTGKHLSSCTCKPAVEGVCRYGGKYAKEKAQQRVR